MKKQNGFSLVELMMVLAVIAIIATIAVPSYQNSMMKASRHEAMVTLLDIMRAQEDYYASNFEYTTTLSYIGYTGTVTAGDDRYVITASKCDGGEDLDQCIKLTANAQTGKTIDGKLELDSRGTRKRGGVLGWSI